MHTEAREFVAQVTASRDNWGRVVEFGSAYINGKVRDLFEGRCTSYHGIDVEPGLGVDEVANAKTWRPEGRRKCDTVVCCEVLEHVPDPHEIIANAAAVLKADGHLIVTCATDPRAPHSGFDGAEVRSGEYYGNVSEDELRAWLTFNGFHLRRFERLDRGDLRAWGVKSK